MNWDNITEILALVIAFAAIVFPFHERIFDRKHNKQMKQMEIYERLNAEAIETFARSANESIMNHAMTAEFKRVNLSIGLHAPARLWKNFATIACDIENGDFEKARTELTNLCMALGFMDYFQCNEKVDSNFTKPSKKRNRKVKTKPARSNSDACN